MKNMLVLSTAILLVSLFSTSSLAQQTASLELVSVFADQTKVQLKAVMTNSGTIMNVEAVSVSVAYDPAQFTVDSLQTITQLHFQQYGWDNTSDFKWERNGINPDVTNYSENHPTFGSAPILSGAPPDLCLFTFFSKQPAGTASFTVHGNNAPPIPAVTYYYEFNKGGHAFTPVQNIVNWQYPVELTSFTAVQQGKSIALRWVTAGEQNNYGFHVQRRAGQGTVNLDWEVLDFVKGAGTTDQQSQYLFFDLDLPSDGVFEYRLKQQDFDGSTSYSPVVRVEYQNAPHHFALQQNYPNPVSASAGRATVITYDIARRSKVHLALTNILGQELSVLVDDYRDAGRYTVSWLPHNLPAGMYVATLTSETEESGKTEHAVIRVNVVQSNTGHP